MGYNTIQYIFIYIKILGGVIDLKIFESCSLHAPSRILIIRSGLLTF